MTTGKLVLLEGSYTATERWGPALSKIKGNREDPQTMESYRKAKAKQTFSKDEMHSLLFMEHPSP